MWRHTYILTNTVQIATNLPSSEKAYQMGQPEATSSLYLVRSNCCASKISTFGAVILIADLIGRIRDHLHLEPLQDQSESHRTEAFWIRHNKLDNDISSLLLSLPAHLKLSARIRDQVTVATAVSINMNIHALTISLHRAMILNLEQSIPDFSSISRSQDRCEMAAEEIVNLLELASHVDLAKVCSKTPSQYQIVADTGN